MALILKAFNQYTSVITILSEIQCNNESALTLERAIEITC